MMNVYNLPEEDRYYAYAVSREYPERFAELKMLVQGGSFADPLLKEYPAVYLGAEVFRIFYNQYITGNDGTFQKLTGWESLDLGHYLNQVDFVVLELNAAGIVSYSSGFVAYLNQYLKDYIPQEQIPGDYPEALEPVHSTGLEKNYGFGDYEGTGVWATDASVLKLKILKLRKMVWKLCARIMRIRKIQSF